MHAYYAKNKEKIKAGMDKYLSLISTELETRSGNSYAAIFAEIWDYYEKNLLENFPYIGGDKVSGTKNLTGAYYFIAMGEVLKRYGADMEEIGHLMVLSYERYFLKIPGVVRKAMGKLYQSPKLLNKMFLK
ncbi:MAG: hypothetical protein Q4A88_09150, partial [Clostridia bacterium]|nr:hypothetical protein [Clostridia bacterium]